MNYSEALAWLYGTQLHGIKLGLENIRRLLGALEIFVPGRIIHVAGTNGKGSVCALADSISREAGYITGLFTSPHLVSFRERIRVNGSMIGQKAVAQGIAEISELVRDWEPHPTFFEITTALALRYFQRAGCAVVVLETGMGGRLDATNAIIPSVSVITPIDFDHQKWLGYSLAEIATEKAGIIKPHVPVVSALQSPEVAEVIRKRAAECHAPLRIVNSSWTKTPIALPGSHQKQNASIAIAALRSGGGDVAPDAIARGLRNADWPARFQIWNDRIVIDGAHNPSGARTLVQTWQEQFGQERATVVFAVLQDKDWAAMIDALLPIASSFLLPKIRGQRAESPVNVAALLEKRNCDYLQCDSAASAISQALKLPQRILITGSLHFCGEALSVLRRDSAALEECAQ